MPLLWANSVDFTKPVFNISLKGIRHVHTSVLPKTTNVKLGRLINEQNLLKDINALYLLGYFEHVEAVTHEKNNMLYLEYVIRENPNIKSIKLKGNTVITDKEIISNLQTKVGQVINFTKLKNDQTQIEKLYHEKGYGFMLVTDIKITPEGHLEISLTEGLVGTTTFLGRQNIKPFIFNRELTLKPGLPFNTYQLRKDRESLLRLGYFSQISPPTITETDDNATINITYNIQEKKINLLNFGIEQEEDRVVIFTKATLHHVIIPSDLISGKIQLEPNNTKTSIKSYSIKYYQPWFINRYPFSLTYDIYTLFDREFLTNDLDKNELFDTRRDGWDIMLGFPIVKDQTFLTTTYKQELVQPEKTSSVFNSYQVHSLSTNLSYTSVDQINNPKKGNYWSFGYEKGGDVGIVNLGGLNFNRFTANSAAFYSPSKKYTLAIRGFMGSFRPDDRNINTFDAEGFELGGANSLRGYKEFDHPFIGNHAVLFNYEFRYHLSDTLQGVLFYDIGQTFSTQIDLNLTNYNVGKGIGIRYFTPVGPIRVDFSFGDDFLIQFGLGQVF